MQKFLLAAIGSVTFLFSAAFAEDDPLTEDQAARFVKTMPELQTLADRFKAEGNNDPFEIDIRPKAGEQFKPYSKIVAGLKADFPTEHKELAATVKPHGFTTEKWGAVGDRVMVAYFALKMQEEDPNAMAQMQAMDASMLQQLPPEYRARMESVMAMMETVKNAPQADLKTVAKVKPELDAYMEEHETMQPKPRR